LKKLFFRRNREIFLSKLTLVSQKQKKPEVSGKNFWSCEQKTSTIFFYKFPHLKFPPRIKMNKGKRQINHFRKMKTRQIVSEFNQSWNLTIELSSISHTIKNPTGKMWKIKNYKEYYSSILINSSLITAFLGKL
jgi:hypothetical protein